LEELLEIIRRLRDPQNGCPWDIKQTHQSLISPLLEEAYELIDAISRGDSDNMREELGDLLLQILLHSQIADPLFNFHDIVDDLKAKLIRRHPHVFGKDVAADADEALMKWKESKRMEGKVREEIDYHLSLNPALTAATNIGMKAHQIGFDWNSLAEVTEVVISEWQELQAEIAYRGDITGELGDLLFSLAQLSRHLNIDPEESLKGANLKFIGRFKKMRALIEEEELDISQMTQMEMEHYWKRVKESTI
jgi:MazG family protein